jgi:hypothetical protein
MTEKLFSIYPLNKINLQALLDYFFPHLPESNLDYLFNDIEKYNITLNELELLAIRILPFVEIIRDRLNNTLTQTNVMDYAIESFISFEFDDVERAPERVDIIKLIRESAGIDQDYDEMISRKDNLITYRHWN